MHRLWWEARIARQQEIDASIGAGARAEVEYVFSKPDIEILPADGEDPETGRVQAKIHGVDVFHPNTGEVWSDGADGIACWFIDTDYNDESFFVWRRTSWARTTRTRRSGRR